MRRWALIGGAAVALAVVAGAVVVRDEFRPSTTDVRPQGSSVTDPARLEAQLEELREEREAEERERQRAAVAATAHERSLGTGSYLSEARIGGHGGFDRVVFDFEGAAPPVVIDYGETADTGDCPNPGVEGPEFLNVRIPSAPGYNPYSGDAKVTDGAAVVSSVSFTCEYEGYLYATISLSKETPFKVTTVGNDRLVVDLATM